MYGMYGMYVSTEDMYVDCKCSVSVNRICICICICLRTCSCSCSCLLKPVFRVLPYVCLAAHRAYVCLSVCLSRTCLRCSLYPTCWSGADDVPGPARKR